MGEATIPYLSGTAGRRTSYDCLFRQVWVTVGGTAPSLCHSKVTAPSLYQVIFLSSLNAIIPCTLLVLLLYVSPSRTHPTGLDRIRPPSLPDGRDGNGRSSDLRPLRASASSHTRMTGMPRLMASGLPEKMSVTIVLAAIRRLQQRDCPGFSPDSLLNPTLWRSPGRWGKAGYQLQVQRYGIFLTLAPYTARFLQLHGLFV